MRYFSFLLLLIMTIVVIAAGKVPAPDSDTVPVSQQEMIPVIFNIPEPPAPDSNTSPDFQRELTQIIINIPEPPAMLVQAGDCSVEAVTGTYNWFITKPDGSGKGICADFPIPPKLVESHPPLKVTGGQKIIVRCDYQPQQIKVLQWQETEPRLVSREPGLFAPDEAGEYIYEISGRWEEGHAIYAFKLLVED